jgi:thiosulfate dehydrogenase
VRTFILGLIIGLVAIPLAVYAYFITGTAPVATASKPMPFEKTLANGALHARIDKEMPKNVPLNADEDNYKAGALVYREHCAVCHGTPGQEQSAIAKGMFPKPPQLFKGVGVTDDEPGETFWKVTNGIRMTGMPSFDKTLSETERWQVSLLLANADKVPDSIKQSLVQPDVTAAAAAQPQEKPANSRKTAPRQSQ